MNLFSTVQGTLLLVLGVVALACEVFALIDALRHRPDAYTAAGKRTNNFRVIVPVVALAVGIITTCNALGFVGVIAFVVAVSAAAGPTVAAAILSIASWPWLFAGNVPLGIASIALAPLLQRTPRSGPGFDSPIELLNALLLGLHILPIYRC